MTLALKKKLRLIKLEKSELRPKAEIFDWHLKKPHRAFKAKAKTQKMRPCKLRGGTDEHEVLEAA